MKHLRESSRRDCGGFRWRAFSRTRILGLDREHEIEDACANRVQYANEDPRGQRAPRANEDHIVVHRILMRNMRHEVRGPVPFKHRLVALDQGSEAPNGIGNKQICDDRSKVVR